MWGEFAHALLGHCLRVGFLGHQGRGLGTAGRESRFQASPSGECAKEQKQFPRRVWSERAENRADLPLLAK